MTNHVISQLHIKMDGAHSVFQYIEVDGNSLRVKDVMEIGNGKYRVKVWG